MNATIAKRGGIRGRHSVPFRHRLPRPVQPVDEQRKRRSRYQTEVNGAAGRDERSPGKDQSCDPSLASTPNDAFREHVHAKTGERNIEEIDDIERRDHTQ